MWDTTKWKEQMKKEASWRNFQGRFGQSLMVKTWIRVECERYTKRKQSDLEVKVRFGGVGKICQQCYNLWICDLSQLERPKTARWTMGSCTCKWGFTPCSSDRLVWVSCTITQTLLKHYCAITVTMYTQTILYVLSRKLYYHSGWFESVVLSHAICSCIPSCHRLLSCPDHNRCFF